jgi:two-component system, OmpR family, response regulator
MIACETGGDVPSIMPARSILAFCVIASVRADEAPRVVNEILPRTSGFVSLRFARAGRNNRKQKSPCVTCRQCAESGVMSESPHILVVEDDRDISRLVGRYLRENDCRVSFAADGREMDECLASSRIDLVVLDVMLPGEDGLSLCRRLRARSHLPVVMLTAKGDELDRIIGIEMGADDYLAKPFNPRELLARIRAVLRRTSLAGVSAPEAGARLMTFDNWQLNCVARSLTNPQGSLVTLTSAEFDLMQALCERAGRTLSRDQLVDITQGRSAGAFERSVDILISRIRRKIERDPHRPEMIKTVRSGGYLFTPDVVRS